MIDDTPAPGVDADSSDPMANWVPVQMTRAQRIEWAQEQIAKLASLEHACVQKLNDILTDEQHVERLKASQQGHTFGLTGLPLYQHVLSSMRLNDEQKAALTAARRELREIREAIAPHVALLLDEQQTDLIVADASGTW